MANVKRSVVIVLLIFCIFPLFGDIFQREWEYLSPDLYNKHYPRNEDKYANVFKILEEARHLIIDGSYLQASEIIQNRIQTYDIESQNTSDLCLLFLLVKMDMAIDYLLLNHKRSGANKHYIMSYICDRLDSFRPNTPDSIPLTEAYSLFQYNAGDYGVDSYTIFKDYIYDLEQPYGWKYVETEFETRIFSCLYSTQYILGAVSSLDLMYDYLVELLFYISDYKNDIHISCGNAPQVAEVCRKATTIMGEGIPVTDSEYPLSIEIYVTHRKDQAVEFFRKYYRSAN